MNKMIMMSGVMFMSVSMSAFGMGQDKPKNSVRDAFKEVWGGFCHCIEILTIGHQGDDNQGSAIKEHSVALSQTFPNNNYESHQDLVPAAAIAAAQFEVRRPVTQNPSVDNVSSTSTIESPRDSNALVSGSSRGEIFAPDILPKNSSWVDIVNDSLTQHQKN